MNGGRIAILILLGCAAGIASDDRAGPDWWSVQPIAEQELPPDDAWCKNAIDRFVLAKLREPNLKPSPEADRRTLIRRLSYDLLGLPPTPEDVDAFIKDPDPLAYAKLVDRYLDSPHYGERWARHWLDIAHYADTHGFERDKLREHAWRYRDYVIKSLNRDKPYNQFLREQIAGDVLHPDDEDSVVATGFLAAGPWDFVGQVETKSLVLRRSARALDLDDMVTQVMTAATAMTVNCARCHDHKLDPISQKEYYQLVSVFAGLKRGDRTISDEALERYEKETKRFDAEIEKVAFAIGELQGQAIDLADVVGGGNGFGIGQKGLGLDARTGKEQARKFGDLGNVKPGKFAKSAHEFVDGVFIPAKIRTQISSNGLKATGLPENSGKAWDIIRNGPVSSQYSTKWGGVNYDSAGHSMIGLHANAGITFDLEAVRRATKYGELRFTAVAGYGGRTVEPSAVFWVFLDGELHTSQRIGRNDAIPLEINLPKTIRFLTLISTDGGNGYGHDQISFGDPTLTPTHIRESTDADHAKLESLRERKTRLEKERKALGSPPQLYGVIAEKPPVIHILDRGNPEAPGDPVSPGALQWHGLPSSIGSNELPEGDRRAILADWLVHPNQPLTRRVIVNRLWHWHFGQGIVSTPSDFGRGGSRPSHPELLDWLAAQLLEENWSLKAIHRLILNSATYRQQSLPQPNAMRIDAGNRFLSRMNARRLEAEAIRDSVLAISGKLNKEPFGPGFRDFDYQEAYAPIYTYKTADSPDLWRRSIYRFVVRTTPQQFMTTLDCPDPANLTPKRNITTTALQSLALYNNEFMLKQAGYFADRLKEEAGKNMENQINLAFRLAFSRSPDTEELRLTQDMIEEHGLLAFCRALLNANEFIYVD